MIELKIFTANYDKMAALDSILFSMVRRAILMYFDREYNALVDSECIAEGKKNQNGKSIH